MSPRRPAQIGSCGLTSATVLSRLRLAPLRLALTQASGGMSTSGKFKIAAAHFVTRPWRERSIETVTFHAGSILWPMIPLTESSALCEARDIRRLMNSNFSKCLIGRTTKPWSGSGPSAGSLAEAGGGTKSPVSLPKSVSLQAKVSPPKLVSPHAIKTFPLDNAPFVKLLLTVALPLGNLPFRRAPFVKRLLAATFPCEAAVLTEAITLVWATSAGISVSITSSVSSSVMATAASSMTDIAE
mmetsp:Transcript_87733/g.174127  ORF Transcript_87733/g.174127 Transcript_87733/m.174127 type:complete len:242 (-) Transcript_87733:75-800(-)